MVIECERAYLSLGKIQYGVQKAEEKSLIYKRSIYIAKDIKKGEQFNHDNTRVIRPGNGLPSKYFKHIIGKTAQFDIKAGTPLSWDLI